LLARIAACHLRRTFAQDTPLCRELGGSSWWWPPASGDGGAGVGRSTDGGHAGGAVAPALASSMTAADRAMAPAPASSTIVLGVVRTGPGDGPTVTTYM
jgi:hypothetical protein